MTPGALAERLEAALAAKAALFAQALDAASQLRPTGELDESTASTIAILGNLLDDVRRIDNDTAPIVEEWRRRGLAPDASMSIKIGDLCEVVGRLRECLDAAGLKVQASVRELGLALDEVNRGAQMRRAYQPEGLRRRS